MLNMEKQTFFSSFGSLFSKNKSAYPSNKEAKHLLLHLRYLMQEVMAGNFTHQQHSLAFHLLSTSSHKTDVTVGLYEVNGNLELKLFLDGVFTGNCVLDPSGHVLYDSFPRLQWNEPDVKDFWLILHKIATIFGHRTLYSFQKENTKPSKMPSIGYFKQQANKHVFTKLERLERIALDLKPHKEKLTLEQIHTYEKNMNKTVPALLEAYTRLTKEQQLTQEKPLCEALDGFHRDLQAMEQSIQTGNLQQFERLVLLLETD